MESYRDAPPDLPDAVYHLLDFFCQAKPADVLNYHRIIAGSLQASDDESKERYRMFSLALEVCPEDNRATPDIAVELYQAFAESLDPIDRQLVSGHFDKLWIFAAGGALALTRQLWIDPNYHVYNNVRLAAEWACHQELLSEETWQELCKVVPFVHWRKNN